VKPLPLDRYLTTKQAAVILGRKPDTLRKWRQHNGKGPKFFRYPDGAIRYSLNELMKFLQDCMVERWQSPGTKRQARDCASEWVKLDKSFAPTAEQSAGSRATHPRRSGSFA
jgi:hypothetical protein